MAATTPGETGGDALSMSLKLGSAVSTLILLVLFLLLNPANPCESLSSFPVLGSHRRNDAGGHHDGGLRGPLAWHRLSRWLHDSFSASPRCAWRVEVERRYFLPAIQPFHLSAYLHTHRFGHALDTLPRWRGGYIRLSNCRLTPTRGVPREIQTAVRLICLTYSFGTRERSETIWICSGA
jgi:Repeat of Unknown Function (DUF347)